MVAAMTQVYHKYTRSRDPAGRLASIGGLAKGAVASGVKNLPEIDFFPAFPLDTGKIRTYLVDHCETKITVQIDERKRL